ncbi:MAG: NADH-quinone oxidoreductase subunit L [Deltaproteobacteria bacterium]
MENWLIIISIFFPILCSFLFIFFKNKSFRDFLIIFASFILIVNSLLFTYFFNEKAVNIQDLISFNLNKIISILDFALIFYILFIGIRLKSVLVSMLAILQMIPLGFLEYKYAGILEKSGAMFHLDGLSIVMSLIVSIIGSIIAIFAIGYMKQHEEHLKLEKSRQPRFFFIIFLFLGAMNGLVLSDNLFWMSFFWEITTLSSFLLIAHDENEESIKNAKRALWINLIGGISLSVGIIFVLKQTGDVSISTVLRMCAQGGSSKELIAAAIVFLCFAGFTKSAQFPFQSWLLGAMVAPTPVSALLHSSTMVKAGVYLIVRFSPAYAGTDLGLVIALAGGFTFMAGSAVAISQSNAKKVLAYSTIANLGLIIACAGIGSAVAVGAAILLIIFHAVSKALMFLCVGTIEQNIGSRDIDDMEGIMEKMPFTAIVAAVGAASMLLPPFGVLVSKWLAIEAAVRMPVVLIFIILGSALTAVFWIKFTGKLLTSHDTARLKMEQLPKSMLAALSVLVTGVIIASVSIVQLFNFFVSPQFKNVQGFKILGGYGLLEVTDGGIIGEFAYFAVFIVVAALVFAIPFLLKRFSPEKLRQPYLCGENCEIDGIIYFKSDSDKNNEAVFNNYYLKDAFSEEKLSKGLTIAGTILMLCLFATQVWRFL